MLGHHPLDGPLHGPLLRWLSRGPLRNTSVGLGPLFTDPSFIDGEFDALFLAPLEDPDVLEDQLKLLRAVDFDQVDALAGVHRRIHAPTLCIWGPDDPFFPVAKARRMLPQFGGRAELVEIPRARLFAHEDHAEEFLGHALPFLERTLGSVQATVRSA